MFFGYDTRTTRRWNLDPIDQIFISNYAGFGNNPIFYSDPTGFAKEIINGKERNLPDEVVIEADRIPPVAPEGLDDYSQGKIPIIKERSPLENLAHNLGIPVGRNVGSNVDGVQEMLMTPVPFAMAMRDLSQGIESNNNYLMGVGLFGIAIDVVPGGKIGKIGGKYFSKTFGKAWHHIVAQGANNIFAKQSRLLLQKFGIGIHSLENGSLLIRSSKFAEHGKSAIHSKIHTSKYYEEVYNRLKVAKTREKAIEIMEKISEELNSNNFPY